MGTNKLGCFENIFIKMARGKQDSCARYIFLEHARYKREKINLQFTIAKQTSCFNNAVVVAAAVGDV